MRVTFNQMRDGLDAINTAAEQLADAQWQVATGYRVRVPSDDPDAAQRAILEQANMDRLDAYKAVADSASSRLTALDTTLGNIVDKITEALTALQSSLGSTATQPVRDAAAATFESRSAASTFAAPLSPDAPVPEAAIFDESAAMAGSTCSCDAAPATVVSGVKKDPPGTPERSKPAA
jgi:uncharacterized protein YdbL (DUF1318 family)